MSGIFTSKCEPDRSCMGGKAYALARLTQEGLKVPEWFVVTPDFAQISHPSSQVLDGFSFTSEQYSALKKALESIGSPNECFAVRSSAVEEDGASASFAGQYESYLNVRFEDVLDKIVDVWRSTFSEHVAFYSKFQSGESVVQMPAVIIQRMVTADCAGVAFSADVVSGRRSTCVINAVHGLGEDLVSGKTDAETWRVGVKGDIIEKLSSPDENVLSDKQAKEVAELVHQCDAVFSRPQDIEWAYEKNVLYVLQSRPITTLDQVVDPEGALNIWDNSNIAESYGGVTTPLTFSFARYIYQEVYQQFCRVMRVPRRRIEDHRSVFCNMLGLIQGRVYYNLLNWYRVLSLLPGFRVNRKFMEQMMGVRESLPPEVLKDLEAKRLGSRIGDAFQLVVALGGLLIAQLRLRKMIRRFYDHFEKTLADIDMPVEQMRADQLATHFHQLEQQLLSRWNAPLVNDFFAMIFFGLLRSLSQKWCRDVDGTLQNGLLCATGNIISAEPARRIREMACIAAEDAELVQMLCEAKWIEMREKLENYPEFYKKFNEYLDRFADRCLNELKLESPTLRDDCLPLLRSVGSLAKRICTDKTEGTHNQGALENESEKTVAERLKGKPFKRLLFHLVLKQTRTRVRDRENLRFERTRLFGRIRHIFVELGKRLYAVNKLADPRDVFYLTIDEVLGFVEGKTVTTDLSPLVKLRKEQFHRHAQSPPPADRFETHGMVYVANQFRGDAQEETPIDHSADLQGIGCCPGIVRGRAHVVRNPKGVQMNPGDILVAEQTDPGWITLFPSSSGVLVQRGSLLSHTAIVAREMSIPAVVSVPGLLKKVSTGDFIEFDGKTGKIKWLGNDE